MQMLRRGSPIALLVIAKAPATGAVKTRLCPPFHPVQAAALAEAALRDTLAAVAASSARRIALVLDGEPGAWLSDRFELIPQRTGDLAVRLSAAFEDAGGPALLIGMDTPQLTPRLLDESLAQLAAAGTDAVLGRAWDGGYWALGLRRPDDRAFRGVPMSTARTGMIQAQRLRELGLRTASLPQMRDVDRFGDAVAVAAAWPNTRFARTLAGLTGDLPREAA